MNKRLKKLLETQPIKGWQMLDCYNQAVSDLAVTITTRVDASNMIYIAEDIKLKLLMNEDKNQERKIVEPFVAASRGREPQCLTPKRTEYGKAIRKQYEAHEVTEQRKNVQKLEPRTDGITNTLTSVQKDNLLCEPNNFRIRKLTPRECFRLMDVDDKDIDTIRAAGISDSQQYKLAGNSIVVNVLTEIFRKLLVDTQNDDGQMRMF